MSCGCNPSMAAPATSWPASPHWKFFL